jgi:hypothetical protein
MEIAFSHPHPNRNHLGTMFQVIDGGEMLS